MKQSQTEINDKTNKLSENSRLYQEAIEDLLFWYDQNHRILPWRDEPTPYHVFLSEIMLQQTRVEAVRGYYARFLSELPTLRDLAEAKEEKLLKLWEGLGYYSRVRNMQKAAKEVMEKYNGEMPADYEKLRTLPGIGDYTAGAISSIAFSLPYPAVDGNVLRVMSRLIKNEADISKEQTKKTLREDLKAIMPSRPGDFNQSLMELGATVCLPNGKPLCDRCPLSHRCIAFHEGKETILPVKQKKKERRVERRNVFLIQLNEKTILHKRSAKGLLAGLFELPEEKGEPEEGEKWIEKLRLSFPEKITISKKETAKHIFSHVEWQMTGYRVEITGDEETIWNRLWPYLLCLYRSEEEESSFLVTDREKLENEYTIPSAFTEITKKLWKEKGGTKNENRTRL